MRLHRLEVEAFGPYCAREVVDFDVLGADGLFLLHGETGAGKTTLLDAIAFALFGVVPGARNEAKRLRCDLAVPQQVTEVALELTVQGHRLKLVRNPEYQRPKRRGEGTTTQQAKVSLSWIGAAPAGLAPEGLIRIEEVARTVERLLGMTAAQFFQVVLLPQGEFARFLRSDTAEREKLLERLFGTERFADVERWFTDLRTERGRALETRQQDVRELLARYAQEAQQDPPGSDPAGWVDAVLAASAERVRQATAEAELARSAARRADASLQEERAGAEKIRRVRTAHLRLVEITGQAPQRAEWVREVAAARRAAGVAVEADLLDRRAAELAEAEQAEETRGAELREFGTPATGDLKARAATAREEAGAVAELVAEAEQQQLDVMRRDDRKLVAVTAAQQAEELTGELAAIPGQLAKLRADAQAAAEAGAKLDGARARVEELTAVARDAAELPEAEAKAGRGEAKLREVVDAHQEARQRRLDLRERRLDGMAAELAAALPDGAPCPVCGSVEHPAPANRDVRLVDPAEERAAEEAEQAADAVRQRVVAALEEAKARLAGLVERLAGRAAESVAAELAEARDAVATLSRRASGKAQLGEQVVLLERDLERRTERRRRAEQAVAEATADVRALEERLAERERRLVAGRGEFADVAARRAHLTGLAEALEAVGEARTAVAGARERVEQQCALVETAVAAKGFPSLEKARAAMLPDEQIEKLEQGIAEAEAAAAGARALLAEPDLLGVSPDDVADVGRAADAAQQARERADSAYAALRVASAHHEQLTGLAGRLREALAGLAPAEAEYAELRALADVVNGRGQNSRKMSLRSYVLAARLEEVAVAATHRLRTMSQGRYSFVHSDAAGARGTRGGLGIDVLDDYSGTIRPAKTLSGGESFLASLALALGLADVVAGETGGALLDTLFVDEGFGTLDAETLDVVMNILDELRAGGRVVGLVSHVEELRQRIPTRLRVRKARTGSSLEVRAG
jgi:exonuclease SbcC